MLITGFSWYNVPKQLVHMDNRYSGIPTQYTRGHFDGQYKTFENFKNELPKASLDAMQMNIPHDFKRKGNMKRTRVLYSGIPMIRQFGEDEISPNLTRDEVDFWFKLSTLFDDII